MPRRRCRTPGGSPRHARRGRPRTPPAPSGAGGPPRGRSPGRDAAPGTAAAMARSAAAGRGRSPFGRHGRRPSAGGDAMSSRILVVEDDERIRSSMRLALEEEGYEVDDVGSGEEALDHFNAQPPDVTLIDLMLPGMDGFECCRALRRQSAVPIIMVTARTDTHDVVAGLEAGADDYVTKPFVAKELGARIRALLRRARPAEEEPRVLTFGDLELIPEQGVLRHRDGHDVHCTRTEFRLLCELASNPNKVLTREQL